MRQAGKEEASDMKEFKKRAGEAVREESWTRCVRFLSRWFEVLFVWSVLWLIVWLPTSVSRASNTYVRRSNADRRVCVSP